MNFGQIDYWKLLSVIGVVAGALGQVFTGIPPLTPIGLGLAAVGVVAHYVDDAHQGKIDVGTAVQQSVQAALAAKAAIVAPAPAAAAEAIPNQHSHP